ncbi:Dps family protein [Sphingomonas sp.]|uniref:Dps family protein n=1 Tax=Sphingomonas sp. TaxID=28214 RepID=UPI003B0003E3
MADAPAPALDTPTDLDAKNTETAADALNGVLADLFALYLKTKNFHWHMSGPHFRDYHLLLDEQADQIFAITDDVAERMRKLGNLTLRSIGDISRRQTIRDNDQEFVEPLAMLKELRDDNLEVVRHFREAREKCEDAGDTPTSSMIDDWIDQAERRAWFLFEAARTN